MFKLQALCLAEASWVTFSQKPLTSDDKQGFWGTANSQAVWVSRDFRPLWRLNLLTEKPFQPAWELSWSSMMTDAPKYLLLSLLFSVPTILGKWRNKVLTLFQEIAKKSPGQHFQTITLQISHYNYTTSQTEKNNMGNSSNVISEVWALEQNKMGYWNTIVK